MKLLKEFLQLGIFNSDKAYIFTVVKPGSLQYTQKIIEKFEENGWRVSKIRTKHLLSKEAHKLYAIHKNKDFYKSLCEYMSSGNSTAIIYTKDEPMSEKVFKEVKQIKDEIREKYGESDMRNVLHSSDSLEHMVEEIKIYFNMKTLNQYIKESLQSKAICNESILDDEEDVISSALVMDFILKNYDVKESDLKIMHSNGKCIVDCNGDVEVKNKKIKQLNNELFEWNKVGGDFDCSYCKLLKTLQGAPKEVDRGFYCDNCDSLKSLEGSPKKVGGNFNCFNCKSLKSLEGSPKEVDGYFNCCECESLKSLQGAPERVDWFFDCYYCDSLESLKGSPKEVGGDFKCHNCKSLKDLTGAPEKVDGNFSCHSCESLESLQGSPKEVGGGFDCNSCKSLTSLEEAPKKVGSWFDCYNCGTKFTKEDVEKVSKVKGKIIV